MPTNTNSKTNRDHQTGYEQPSYQPWDDVKGTPYLHNSDNGDGNGIGNHDNGNELNDRRNSAIDSLRGAEQGAVSRRELGAGNNADKSFYTGKGKEQQSKSKKGGLKGKLKGKGALITIAIFLFGGGAFLSASNSILGPAISALATMNTQVENTSYMVRSKYIMSSMINGSGMTTTNGFTGSVKYARIPKYMKKRLANSGFEVTGSGKNTRLSWTHATKSGGTETISDIDAQTFLNMYNDDVEFRDSFVKAKRGRVATFFDNIADKIYSKWGTVRNWFAQFRQSQDAETDMANFKETLSPKFDNKTTTVRTGVEGEPKQAVDDNGNPIFEKDANGNDIIDSNGNKVPVMEPDVNTSSGSSKTQVDADANTKAGGFIKDVAGTVGQLGTWACTAMKVGSTIATAAASMEVVQSINYFMGLVENISKMKYGYGDQSAFNTLMNFFSTSATASIEDYANYSVGDISKYTSDFETAPVDTIDETGAPTESAGMQSFLANQNGAQLTSRTKNYSLERVIISLGGAAAFGTAATQACVGVDVTNSLIAIAGAIGAVATGGIGALAVGFFAKFAFSALISVSVSAFLSFLVPTVANILFNNAFDDAKGMPAGELFARGASLANQMSGKTGSGLPILSKDNAIKVSKLTNEVIAMEAETDRLNHSPFDVTNPNTFFGSIAYSLLPTMTSTNTTGIASFIRSAGRSLSTLMGGVSADGEGSSYLTTFGDCPLNESVGAAAGPYCDTIYGTDPDTLYIEPNDPNYTRALMESPEPGTPAALTCDDDGNCEVNDNSNLAKYITICKNRESMVGVVDQNFLGALEKGNVLVNSIPYVSDVLGLINAGIDAANIPWANGKKCIYSDDNDFWNTEGKYYYRYIEDQRILDQMGANENEDGTSSVNPITAYEERYEKQYLEEHPEADTFIGYLSRISGLTPENTETMLAFITYYDFVNQYDPTLRIAMEGKASDIDDSSEVIAKAKREQLYFPSEELIDNPIEDKTIAREHIVYADVRNRSYAVWNIWIKLN